MTGLLRLTVLAAAAFPMAAHAQSASSPSPAVLPPIDRAEDIVVTGNALPLTQRVTGQTATTIGDAAFRDTPATTIADIVKLSPGVAVIQGNGPRDVSVSVRGSNARNSFGARNIQVFEDDFPVTQPDGLARFDLTDPHAYAAVDVVRGPSSALYGNYAIGGAVNFRTRRGRDVRGADAGLDVGGDGYVNAYATVGDASEAYDYALFGSFVTGRGATGHTGYTTGTLNGLATFALSERDRITAKLIHNQGEFRLSNRLSYNQYRLNPYQQGCERAEGRAPGCGTVSVLLNGTNGPRVLETANEADLARDDRRTIVGLRYEHDLDAGTTWRTQGVFDSRVVDQPTSATPFKGTLDSYALSTDVTRRGQVFGMDATSFAGLSYGVLDNQSYSFNKMPGGRDAIGAPTQTVLGNVRNLALRARQELALAGDIQLVAGLGAERSIIDVRQTAYAYPVAASAVVTTIPARRRFWNVAPEASLLWRASSAVRLHARLGTGYGIPQSGSLFVTPAGVPGNNVALKTQRNTGVDLGAEVTLGRISGELTGYYEWFHNEQVSQSAGVDLLAYTTNAPRSVHRGVEAAVRWEPVDGLSLLGNYSYNDQRYTRFVERLTSGATSAAFDRDGNRIPGVIPSFANVRLGYDRPAGRLEGLGGFVELTHRGRYFIDNGNLLKLPASDLVNLNLHYDPPGTGRWWSQARVFASVQNLFDRTTIGSGAVIANSINAATGAQNAASVLMSATGSIYAGAPRTFYVGLKGRFR